MKNTLRVFLVACMAVLFSISTASAFSGKQFSSLVVIHDANYPPFAFVDEGGTPRGYLIDLWRAFGKANDVEISFVLAPWQEALDLITEGKADVHAGLFYSPERDKFLDFGPTTTTLSSALYADKKLSDDACNTQPIGVIKGGYAEWYMHQHQPNRRLVIFSQNKALITAAANNQINLFITERPTAFHYMKRQELLGRFHNVKTLYSLPMRIAVSEGRSDLLAFIENGWSKIDGSTNRKIHDHWFVPEENPMKWVLTGITLTGLAIIIALFIRLASRWITCGD